MYSIILGKLGLLVSAVSCLWSFFILGKYAIALCQQDIWNLVLFISGSFSIPYLGYAIRSYGSVLFGILKFKLYPSKKLSIFDEHSYHAIVLPSDLDVFNHMNNARYQREIDFARGRWYTDTGLIDYLQKNSYWIMVGTVVRYRKSLEVFQSFTVKTKMVYWDEKHTYLQHTFVRKDSHGVEFVHAIVMTKMRVLGDKTAEEVLREFLQAAKPPQRPVPTEELEFFMKYNDASSLSLRNLRRRD